MGAIVSSARTGWKRNPSAGEKRALASAPVAGRADQDLERPRKRLRQNDAREIEHAQAVPKDTKKAMSAPKVVYDATPDGSVHRYKVNCPSMFWSNKKEVARVIARLKDMPPYNSLLKISKWDHFFISFPNEATAKAGVEKLSEVVHKGDTWSAVKVAAMSAKRTRINQAIEHSKQRDERADLDDATVKTSADVTAPWRNVPYEEQIERKKANLLAALSNVTDRMWRERFQPGSVPWLDALRPSSRPKSHTKPPPCCPLDALYSAEGDLRIARDRYRNKTEFTAGYDVDNAPTIGYSLGLVRDGEVRIGPVLDDCLTTSGVAQKIASVMTNVVRQSGRVPYDKRTHKGYWRQVLCRHSDRTKMLIVVVMVSTSSVEEEEEKSQAPHVRSHAGARWPDATCRTETVDALDHAFRETGWRWGLLWQVTDQVSGVASEVPMTHVHGIQSLDERLLDLTFRVHPSSFFQVNTHMAEVLYSKILEMAGVTKDSTVLDVCCGTGTIGLAFARHVKSVVGIEMCKAAVLDARHNASLNGISNSVHIVGKVEDAIKEALSKTPSTGDVVAVLDPPRGGVHNNVIVALRNTRTLRRVVYVACEPKNLWRNASALCRPTSKLYGGLPFKPVRAIGVDLFPHTACAELAVCFER